MSIEELIAKHLLGLSDRPEQETLRQWADESPGHAACLDRLLRRRNFREGYRAWCAARPHRHAPVPLRRRTGWRQVLTQAAVWTLPVMVVLGLWMALHPAGQPDEILPGGPRATLYLENGDRVELGHSKELGWIRISDNLMAADENGRLRYGRNDGPRPRRRNTLATPRGGEYRLTLPDGTSVHLNALSELTYPLAFDEDRREVTLTGEAYFEVAKDAARPFIVRVDGLAVRQYGTKFSVKARSPQATVVALEEGSVGLCAPDGREWRLLPGQAAEWNGEQCAVEEGGAERHAAWHRSRFVFDNETLGEIMETLSLWYDMEVRFEDAGLAALHFTGNVGRYDDIRIILKGMEATVNVEFDIRDRSIRIMRKR